MSEQLIKDIRFVIESCAAYEDGQIAIGKIENVLDKAAAAPQPDPQVLVERIAGFVYTETGVGIDNFNGRLLAIIREWQGGGEDAKR